MKKKRIIIMFLFLLFTCICVKESPVLASSSDSWAIVKGTYNKNQWTIRTDDEKIIQQGYNNKGEEKGIKYRTKGYYMTLSDKYKVHLDDGDFNTIYPGNQKTWLNVTHKSDSYGTDKLLTTYTIQYKDFIASMTKLGVTAKDFLTATGQKKSISVYLHSVYESYNGATGEVRKTNIAGYKNMMDAEAWSSETRTLLRDYYNFEYQINAAVFDIEIVAVDSEGNMLEVLREGEKGVYTLTYPFTS